MRLELLAAAVTAAALCVLSGIADAQGFVHASRMWADGRVIWPAAFRSAGGFAAGIGTYWIAVRCLQGAGVHAADLQTAIWFVATVGGVALATGRFTRWPLGDQVVGAIVVAGLAWLLVRAAGQD